MSHKNESECKNILEDTQKNVLDMLKKSIRPEFLNRIDEIIMFQPLNESQIADVVRLQLGIVIRHLASNGIDLQVTDAAVKFLAQAGYDPEFGARPVKRAIQKDLLNDLSKTILSGQLDRSKPIVADCKNDTIVFDN